jgi:large subunit ribosomal protein L3
MTIGLVGKKCGMTRIFKEDGTFVPVTILEVMPNRVTQVKTVERDGYRSIQVTTGTRRSSRVTRPLAHHFAKANVEAGYGMWEFRLESDKQAFAPGDEVKVSIFADGQYVDVSGVSKGKGFAGTIKRHNFKSQRASHGNSRSHRVPGSIGQNQTPGRVFKGKKMCGHMGSKACTVQNLQIVRVDNERNLLLVSGAVPGAPGNDVIVRPAVKKQGNKE